MSNKQNDLILEDLQVSREVWLSSYFAHESDVMRDEQGEYIFTEEDNGEPSDVGFGRRVKVYLPSGLHKNV